MLPCERDDLPASKVARKDHAGSVSRRLSVAPAVKEHGYHRRSSAQETPTVNDGPASGSRAAARQGESARRRVPVLIVGGGPVGLGLALDLGWRGVPCLLVEQTEGTIAFPRANGINVRTMEFCRRWGIADAVRRAGPPLDFPHTSLYLTSFAGYELARFERPIGGSDRPSLFSPVSPQRCNQIWFDPILRKAAEAFPGTRLRYRCRFESFVQDEDCVTATVTDLSTGRKERIEADYLVACCGGRSGIRQSLGIGMDGLPAFGTVASIAFRVQELWAYHDKGKAALLFFVGSEGIWATMISLNGRDLWLLSVQRPEGEEVVPPGMAEVWLRQTFGREIPHEIVSVTPWVRRELVADRYVAGRVILAGDCAHMNGPEGGYGMNTGMADAVDLGWKLEAVISGWGGPSLLASYEAERRPVALRTVAEATRNKQNYVFDAPAILEETLEGARQRQEMSNRLTADSRRRHGVYGVALGYRYVPSPICCTEQGDGPQEDISTYDPSSRPGHRAPHAWLRDGRSTLDLFGRGFTLLRMGADAPPVDNLRAVAARRGMPLKVIDIDDPEPCALYEKKLVLVRPDGHVAWRGDDLPVNGVAVIDRMRGAA